ncbi:hypothetical protein [Bartonella sp. DB5-6]|uniref:hypothetical protein n=1 Tax=Bartonella sp. DB5-6 TaxID=1094755 RepID=UPI0002D8B8F3|nr:hypothetical protein [Bartonella sp. DB5-6]
MKVESLPVQAMLGAVTGWEVHLSYGDRQHGVLFEGKESGFALISGLLQEHVHF